MNEAPDIERISQELVGLLGTDGQVEPFSLRHSNFDLEHAYDIVSRVGDLRRARGESPVGRKIGFTNRSIWGDSVFLRRCGITSSTARSKAVRAELG